MSSSDQDVYTDPLFVGLTRPATIAGIPYSAFVIEFVGTAIFFLAVGNPLYLLTALPSHAILYLISAHNPKAFNSIGLWMKTNAKCVNTRFWGAVSFSPLPSKKWTE